MPRQPQVGVVVPPRNAPCWGGHHAATVEEPAGRPMGIAGLVAAGMLSVPVMAQHPTAAAPAYRWLGSPFP